MVRLKVTRQMSIAEVEMLEDMSRGHSLEAWDQLVCCESGKNWEAWERQALSGGVRKETKAKSYRSQSLSEDWQSRLIGRLGFLGDQ